MVKTPKGELSGAEIRKLIRAHNTLVKKNLLIKIPTGTTREGLIKLVEDKGYSINHTQKKIEAIIDAAPYDFISLDQAKELTKPKPLTEEQKKKRQQAKQKKAGEKAFLKTVIPKPPPVSKPSKGIKVGKPPPKKKESKKEKGKFDAFDKVVEEVKKEVTPIIVEWLKIKKDPKLVATLKDKDGNPIKKVKGGRKPLFVKKQDKYRDMVWNKVKEIYKRNNVSMPKKMHGASLFARSKGDWKTYGGLPKELEEKK